MKRYRVIVERSGDWWALSFPDVKLLYSQTKRLDKIRAVAIGALSAMFDVPESAFDVDIEIRLDHAAEELVNTVRARRQEAEAADRAARESLAIAVAGLGRKYTVRDIGEIVGLSHQRVAQIATKSAPTTRRKTVVRAK